jgi:hypothetical protein
MLLLMFGKSQESEVTLKWKTGSHVGWDGTPAVKHDDIAFRAPMW